MMALARFSLSLLAIRPGGRRSAFDALESDLRAFICQRFPSRRMGPTSQDNPKQHVHQLMQAANTLLLFVERPLPLYLSHDICISRYIHV